MAKRGEKVTIIGSGIIGKAWASLFLRGSYNVVLYDIVFTDTSLSQKAVEAVCNKIHVMNAEGLLNGLSVDDCMSRLSTAAELSEALQEAIYVQECVPENVELKIKVFKELDKFASDDMILASSTSCIVPSKFVSDLCHKDQCIVAHPLNPPQYVPVVEILPSPYTRQSIVDSAVAIMKRLGQSPIIVKKETNGFIINRLQYALIMESWRLVEDGIASPEDIDTALTDGLGLRYSVMGPFEVMHLNANGVKQYCDLYGRNIEEVCKTQDVRSLSGETLDSIQTALESKIPLDKLDERRKLRDEKLAILAQQKKRIN